MRRKLCMLAAGLGTIVVWQISGCANVIPQQTFPYELGSNGVFQVEPSVPVETRLKTDNFNTGGITLGRGSLRIGTSAITVTPAGTTEKGAENLQAIEPVRVTAWIDEFENSDTACGSEDEYGPYVVELDEAYNVVSITPNSITLSENTLRLFNLGRFSVCVRVEWAMSGTVEIDTLTFTLGL